MNKKLSLTDEFDVVIKDADGQHVTASCAMTLPVAGWDTAVIELAIPQSINPVPHLKNPCSVEGADRFGRIIRMTDVWYSGYTQSTARRAGVSPMTLTHIGQIVCTHFYADPEATNKKNEVTMRLYMAQHEYLRRVFTSKVLFQASGQTEELLELSIPVAETVQFIRHWSFAGATSDYESYLRCSIQAIFKGNSDIAPSMRQRKEAVVEALIVPSVLSRQRLHVLGWRTEGAGLDEQVWHNPIGPIAPKSMPSGAMVTEDNFVSLSDIGIKNFHALTPELKKVLLHISIGIAPYIDFRDPEHFLTMFHALEACRQFATEKIPPNLVAENTALIEVLQDLKAKSSTEIGNRLAGFIKTVDKGKMSLTMQLNQVLDLWGVPRHDLWPLTGTDKLPGLKDIRDRLSHKGSVAANHQGLAVAIWHLQVLLERIFLCLTAVPMDNTDISPVRICMQQWHRPAFVREQQALVFKPD